MEGRIPGTIRREGTPMIGTGRGERILKVVQREPESTKRNCPFYRYVAHDYA